MHPYPYDYVISNCPHPILTKTIPLGWSGRYLCVSPGVPIRRIESQGREWFLLGVPIGQTPEQTDDIYRESCAWGGRWILIGEQEIIPDAAAMFACYYGKGIASNPTLLTEQPPSDPAAIREGFIVPPESGYDGISRLLPSQVLDIETGRPKLRQIDWVRSPDYDKTLRRLANKYQTMMRSVYASHPNIWVTLTGGRDSRLILAIAHAAGVPITTYTFRKPWGYMTPADRDLPPELAKIAGYPHVEIPSGGLNLRRLRTFRELVDRFSLRPGTTPFYAVYGYMDRLPKQAALLDGLCGELGRLYYEGKPLDRMAPQTQGNKTGLRRLNEWWSQHPAPIPDSERFYWEARLPGWVANTQRLDDFAYQGQHAPMLFLNCLSTYIDILGLDESKRRNGRYIQDLIELMFPKARGMPINPPARRVVRYGMRAVQAITAPYYRVLEK